MSKINIKGRTFLLEKCKLNVSQAKEFGPTEILFGPEHSRNSIWDSKFKCQILEAMVRLEYNPKRDHFIVAGHMVPLAITIATLVQHYGAIRVLFFSAVHREYVSRTIGDPIDATKSSRDLREGFEGTS